MEKMNDTPRPDPSILAKLDASNDLSNPANRPRVPQDMSAHGVPEVEQDHGLLLQEHGRRMIALRDAPLTPAEQRTGVSDVQHAIADEISALRAEVQSYFPEGWMPSEIVKCFDRIEALVPQRATLPDGTPLWVHLCGHVDSWHHVKAFESVPFHGGCDHCDSGRPRAGDWRALYTVPGR